MSTRTPRARTPRAALSPTAEPRLRRSSSTAKTTPLTPRANGNASRRKSVRKTNSESIELQSTTAPDTNNSLNTAAVGNVKALPATPEPIVAPQPPPMSRCKKCVFGGIVALTAAQLAFVCLNASKLSYSAKLSHLAIMFVTMCGLIAMLPPLAQSLSYHNFADQRSLCCGIPNTFDVTSNFPFLLFGSMGMIAMVPRALNLFSSAFPTLTMRAFGAISEPQFIDHTEQLAWWIFFAGCSMTALGSTYYHWKPNNKRLIWDRLPMTLGFMAIYSIVLHERLMLYLVDPSAVMSSPYEFKISVSLNNIKHWIPFLPQLVAWLPVNLTIIGLLSVVYWAQVDDLRPYLIVQFYPLLTIPVLLALFPARFTHSHLLLVALGWYALAKVVEVLDRPIFKWTRGLVSGHTLKHLISSLSMLWCVMYVVQRRSV